MDQEKNILNLFKNTIAALKTAINSDINKSLQIQLNQKLFLLETALNDFKENHVDLKKSYLQENEHNLKKSVAAFEKDIIRDAIALHGSKRKAATALGVDHSTLIKKCQRYGI